jgi:hypothetical protein
MKAFIICDRGNMQDLDGWSGIEASRTTILQVDETTIDSGDQTSLQLTITM